MCALVSILIVFFLQKSLPFQFVGRVSEKRIMGRRAACRAWWTVLLVICAVGSSTSTSASAPATRDAAAAADDGGDVETPTYTDQWAVHVEGGPQVADEVAQRNDFINLGQVSIHPQSLVPKFLDRTDSGRYACIAAKRSGVFRFATKSSNDQIKC